MAALKNARHEHFAHLVAKGTSARQAYIAAGYSENGADQSSSKLLKKTEVAARVAEIRETIMSRAIEKTGIDKAWVLDQLVEVVKMAKQAEPVTDHEGNPTGEYKQNLAAANRALELIGKELEMFVDRKEIRTGPLDQLPRDDLKALEELLHDLGASGQPSIAAGTTRITH